MAIYYAAALPEQIAWPAAESDKFPDTYQTSIKLAWTKPVLSADQLPILSYRVYWDASYLLDFPLLAEIFAYDQPFFNATNLTPGKLYKFQVTATNAIGGEGANSTEVSAYAHSVPGKPYSPYRTDTTASSITLAWYPLTDTGGVPLTGYKLYATLVSSGVESTVYDGTGAPEILTKTITGLTADVDYEFTLSGLNHLATEGSKSDPVTYHMGALPLPPASMTEVTDSRTATSIGLQWTASTDTATAIYYTLV